MTEQQLQVAVQALIAGLAEYDAASVTVNDWSPLDGPMLDGPFAIVGTGDRYEKRPRSTEYGVAVILVEPFVDWPETLGNLSAHRDVVASALINETAGLNSVQFTAVDDVGVYPVDAPLDNPPYLVQTFELVCLQGA